MKKVLVSGIQSSGKLHIGNYFGAIKQNIELGNSGDYESYIFIADYHSMTSLTDGKERKEHTFDAACTYLACGLDPQKVALFVQSSVPSHTELAWVLNTITPMPMLHLAHAFKDSEAKNKDVNVGLFTYPVLMASDILMYNADIVPVGKDQEQHIEITREIAGKFNRAYQELFTMPQAYIVKDLAVVPGIDGTKMSKSKNNHIPLFGTDEEIKKRVMSIVTDSKTPEEKKNPDENSIYQIHKLFLSKEEDSTLRAKFENADTNGGYGYKEAKEACAAAIIAYITPLRERYTYYQTHKEEVYEILKEGSLKARERSEKLMSTVREVTGLS
jgi:tryptophanyl-tRNA synthetase